MRHAGAVSGGRQSRDGLGQRQRPQAAMPRRRAAAGIDQKPFGRAKVVGGDVKAARDLRCGGALDLDRPQGAGGAMSEESALEPGRGLA